MRIFVMLLITATFSLSSGWVFAETLQVTYLNNPRSMKTFSFINTQCAAHYLSGASKVTDQMASQVRMKKDEVISILLETSKFHAELTSMTEGMIHSKDKPPINIQKLSEQLMAKIIKLASDYAPLPVEYQSTSDLCQSIQNNPKSYTAKLDKP